MKLLNRLRYGRPTRDHCEVCGKRLRERERVERAETFAYEVHEGIGGGGGITATYCPSDAPEEAA